MKMKNIFYLFLMVSITFFACDPLDETYEELDKTAVDPTSIQVFEITLTEDDYALLDDEDIEDSFPSEEDAKTLIPVILEKLYPQLGNGSSITVTYRLSKGGSESLATYTEADTYTLSRDDYYMVSDEAGDAAFFNEMNQLDSISSILNAGIQDPVDEQLIAVKYEYADFAYENITGEVVYSQDFVVAERLDSVNTVSVSGAQEWGWSDAGGSTYAKMSGYSGSANANEDWLVTPQIDLTSYTNLKLKVRQAINFAGATVIGEDISVKVSTDSTTWTDLELNVWPAGNSWSFVDSEANLNDYEGEKIYIAFRYVSTTSDAATWEISDIVVESGEPVATNKVNAFYQYVDSVATWYPLNQDEVYYLSSDDYDVMGAPGSHDNFSNSVRPEEYIPTFLNLKYPYAQEGDEIIIIYKYYAGSVYTSGNYYTYENGQWVASTSTLQFGKEEGAWVPDNTIRYTFAATDYTDVGNNASLASEAAIANLQRYGNFNTNEWTPAELLNAISFILKSRFPNSAVGQKYLVTYNTYPGGDLEMHVILNASGEYELL